MPSSSWPTHSEWIGLMSLLVFMVSIEQLAVILTGLPVCVTWLFSLAAFTVLSFRNSVPLLF